MYHQNQWTPERFARMIDNTLLAPDAVRSDFEHLCEESRRYGFKMVAVNSAAIPLCRELLRGSEVAAGAAISFPLGQCLLRTKLHEVSDSLETGAQEIDYVINIGRLKDRDYAYLEQEMRQITDLCHQAGAVSKVIFENCYLTGDEMEAMCKIACEVRPDFIKTSTGFGPGGATVEDVALMKRCVGDRVKIKAAGGIRTLDGAFALVEAGAERLGTSRGAALADELRERLSAKESQHGRGL